MSITFAFAFAAFVASAVFLTLIVLFQRGRGLNSLLGGSGGNSLLGAQTPTALTWMTAGAFGLFLCLAIALNLMSR